MSDQITYIPVSALREHPDNPRKHFDGDGLLDLAESIKAQGMLQPIVVRPLQQADLEHRYEIVFGHRRFRAAKHLPEYMDGTLGVPCILREMDDMDVALAQVAENLQRQDVTAIEEADGFRTLTMVHRLSADAVAERVGKSRSYVYARLKLAQASPDVRSAVLTKGLLPEVALEVARLRGDKLQRMGLDAIKLPGDEWESQRRAKHLLREMQTKCRLDGAPFDPADVTYPNAPACAKCPQLAANDPDLAGLPADVCTGHACFDGKVLAQSQRVVLRLKAEGKPVIEGAKARELFDAKGGGVPRNYYPADNGNVARGWAYTMDGESAGYKNCTMAAALEELRANGVDYPTPEVTHIVNPETGLSAAYLTHEQREQLNSAWDKMHEARAEARRQAQRAEGGQTPSTAARARDGWTDENDRRDWTPAELVATDTEAWARVKEAVMRNLLTLPRTTDDLRAILLAELDQADGFGPMSETMGLDAELDAARGVWEADNSGKEPFIELDWWRAKLASMSADALGALLLGCKLWDLMGYGQHYMSRETSARRVALAERYGVDVVAAAQPEVNDDAGAAGGQPAKAGATGQQLDAFGAVPA